MADMDVVGPDADDTAQSMPAIASSSLDTDAMIDALAYIDLEYGTLVQQAKGLVQLETKQMGPFDASKYLQHMPPPPELKFSSAVLQEDFKRASQGERMPPVDMARYKVAPPTGKDANKAEKWTEAIAHVRTQLEHQNTRSVNLELMKRFGANAWRVHNERVAQMKNILEQQTKANQDEADALNRKRKADQLEAQPKLYHNMAEYWQYVHKTHQIEAVCQNLERQVKRLKTTAMERGLLKPEEPEGAQDMQQ